MAPSPQSAQSFVREGKLDREAVAAALKGWLGAVMPKTGMNLRCKIQTSPSSAAGDEEFERPEIVVLFDGPDVGMLLDRGAETLLALEYLAVRSLRIEPPFFDRIRFDAGDYRAARISELKLAARVAADRVRDSRQPFRMNPMTARERRIVHLALKEAPGIRTSSDGMGEERQVVIYPAETI
ncbi:MAG TPA: R3H domain-containing nucleic acid-binding protein [Candidatus Acidoferrales bacterium]|jgi:spoIIIJ-associated protein|nr:R3H domain-containing nucleic acid-binding protein [Candidatus Acidoferrales bacterium]